MIGYQFTTDTSSQRNCDPNVLMILDIGKIKDFGLGHLRNESSMSGPSFLDGSRDDVRLFKGGGVVVEEVFFFFCIDDVYSRRDAKFGCGLYKAPLYNLL